MVIAVSTRLLVKGEWEGYSGFVYETFSRITRLHPEHTFLFISDKPRDLLFVFTENVVFVSTGPPAKNIAQLYLWYNIKIPAILKKYKAEVFVSPDGLCSLTTKIPQCLFIYDLAFLYRAARISKSHSLFYKKLIPRFIKKATVVATVSEFTKAAITKQYKTKPDKIKVVFGGVNDNFIPVPASERENVKAKYADSNEYFIYTGEIGGDTNLLNLLKAFSAFKKRQKSNMQLLIAGKPGRKYEAFFENLRLFKFKEEVKLLSNLSLSEVVLVTASAYAMVYPGLPDEAGLQCVQAMKSGVPVITSTASAMSEICGDAALYADPGNFKEIAIQMMLIFKDENLRRTLIERAKLRAEKFTWEVTSNLFWNVIEKTKAW